MALASVRYDSHGKVLNKPVVLVAAHCKVSIVGKIDHVGWAHVRRVPQGAV